jgi:DNA-binding LytR/AlgR family response regulator
MNTIKCLIVDDEPIGREIIENFAKKINFLEVVAVCEDAVEALDILGNHQIDLLLSDIQMPEINGLEFIRSLPSPPVVIFITAHDQFAVNSFELGVVDYLLKPVSFDRFLKAINKARLQIDLSKKALLSKDNSIDSIFIRSNNPEKKVFKKINLADILYVKASGDYVKIYTSVPSADNTSPGEVVVTHSSMKTIEEKLPSNQFVRIHNSYIVSVNAIREVEGMQVKLIGGEYLPISKSYKDQLFGQ